MKTIGEFEVSVADPSPCWCELKSGGDSIRFSHHDLSDLEHAVKEMKRMAYAKLPERDRHEV